MEVAEHEIFRVGEVVVWNESILAKSPVDLRQKYGRGPFTIAHTQEAPMSLQQQGAHRQHVRIADDQGNVIKNNAYNPPQPAFFSGCYFSHPPQATSPE